MGSRFTNISRALVGMVVLVFLSAYLFESILLALAGAGFLLFLTYRRMEFHSMVMRVGLTVERSILEEIVHKDSICSIRLKVTSGETTIVSISERMHRSFIPRSGDRFLEGKVNPDRPLSIVYSMVPKERGYFRFPPLKITIKEMRGLFEKDIELDLGTEIFVRASKKEISIARLMSKRKQFEITGPAHKRHTRTYRADFRTIREYIPGDRFRDIDWKAMSRFTRLMTKEFEQETNLPTMIMIDGSLPMREMVKQRSKLEHAIALALQAAVILDSNGHPVGFISYDENKVIEHLSPGRCELDDVVMALFKLPNPVETGGYPGMPRSIERHGEENDNEFLSKVGPFLVLGERNDFTRDRTTGIFEAMRAIEMTEETGMLLIIISDMETNRSSMLRSLQLSLKRDHRVVLVTPFSWPYHTDSGDISVKTVEMMYEDHLEKQTLLRSLRAGGVKVIDIDLNERGDKVIAGIRRLSQ